MEKIEISRDTALEIIIVYMETSGYAYSKIESVLLDEAIIPDIVPYNEFIDALKNVNNDTLKKLLEII